MARKRIELSNIEVEVPTQDLGTKLAEVVKEENPVEVILDAADNYAKYNADKLFATKMEGKFKEIVKSYMMENSLEYFNATDATVKLDKRVSQSYDEELLIAKIKELGIPGIVKTKEYIDMEALESALYHKEIDASELAGTQVVSESFAISVKSKSKKA